MAVVMVERKVVLWVDVKVEMLACSSVGMRVVQLAEKKETMRA